jgi:hypothetical protein
MVSRRKIDTDVMWVGDTLWDDSILRGALSRQMR